MQKFKKIYVVKIGGEILLNKNAISSIAADIAWLSKFLNIVVVHGGGKKISEVMGSLGKRQKFIDGLRVTDSYTIDIVVNALSKINTSFIETINKYGGNAIGLSGGNLFLAKKIPDLGFVGEVEKVNVKILRSLLDQGYIPIITPVGMDKEGNVLNINADIAVGTLAAALKTEKLIIISNTGLLYNLYDKKSIIEELSLEEAKKELENKRFICDGMLPKLRACVHALENSVKEVYITGHEEHVILRILTGEDVGTKIRAISTRTS